MQKILGFEFSASVVLAMKEVDGKVIEFDMVESRDFKVFMGKWIVGKVGAGEVDGSIGCRWKGTRLVYEVMVAPKGLVPVKALEWRIGEDVPGNLKALKRYCEMVNRRENRRRALEQDKLNGNGDVNVNASGQRFESVVSSTHRDVKVT